LTRRAKQAHDDIIATVGSGPSSATRTCRPPIRIQRSSQLEHLSI